MKAKFEASPQRHQVKVKLNMTRGENYWEGWKGDGEKSGGLLFNIGVHYFDLLLWLFGECEDFEVEELLMKQANGTLKLKKADVEWEIDLTAPRDNQTRVFEIDGTKLNLTSILESLHNKVYERLSCRMGTTLDEVKPVIELCEAMTNSYEE